MGDKVPIDKGVPIPRKNGIGCKYPIAKLLVGDSFLVEPTDRNMVYNRCRRRGFEVTTRKEGKKVRVWRIK